MKLLHIYRTQLYFIAFIVQVSVTEEKSTIVFATLALFINTLLLIIKVSLLQNKIPSHLYFGLKVIEKLALIILLSVKNTQEPDFSYFCNLQYTLLGYEIKRATELKCKKSFIKPLIVAFSMISFTVGQICSLQITVNVILQLVFVQIIWLFEILRVFYLGTHQEKSPQHEENPRIKQTYTYIEDQIANESPKPTIKKTLNSYALINFKKFPKEDIDNGLLQMRRENGTIIDSQRRVDDNNSRLTEHQGFVMGYQQNSVNEIIENQKNFYQILFNQFPDGMIILGENKRVNFCNQNTRKILSAMSKDQAAHKVLQLKNCHDKFAEQAQFQKMFNQLKNKMSLLQNQKSDMMRASNQQNEQFIYESDSDESMQVEQENEVENLQIQFSNKGTVLEEYEHSIQRLKSQPQLLNSVCSGFQRQVSGSLKDISLQKDAHSPQMTHRSYRHTEKIKFVSEVKMLCFDNEMVDEIQQNDESYQKQSSHNNVVKYKLLEVTIKAYLFENKPNVLIMIKDVTLFNQYSVLEQTNANKSKMLYQVAHEFRTPLSCIILLTEALVERFKQENELCQQFFQPVLTSASQLLSLVNDLLDLAQLKAGKFKLTNQEFDLIQTLYSICQMLTPSVRSKGINLKLVIDKKLPQFIKSDPNRIRQVVINLIGNAIKFTAKGSITVEAKQLEKNLIKIKVIDTGVGIDKDELPNLFRAFGKIEGTSHMNNQGVGLGLMISHILAQKLSVRLQIDTNIGNGISVHSEGKGQGTQFSFEIYNHNIEDVGSPSGLFMNQNLGIHQDDKYKSQADIRNNESNVSIRFLEKHFEPKHDLNLSGSKIQNPRKVGVHSSQQLLTDSKIEFTFYLKSNEEAGKNSVAGSPVSRQLLEIAQVKRTRFLSINLGGGDTQLIKLDFPHQSRQEGLPQIVGEKEDDFSPKDLDVEKTLVRVFKTDNTYWFKNCLCAEVLIIDDQMFNINVLQLSLKKYQLKIISATSCDEAITKLKNISTSSCCDWIKIILMDIEMNGVDGLESTRMIRQIEQEKKQVNPFFCNSFIIGLSGHGQQLRKKCLESGMDEYFMKPLNIQGFLFLVSTLARKFSSISLSRQLSKLM